MPGPAQVGVANVKIRADTAGFQSEAEAGVSGAMSNLAKKGAAAAGIAVGASLTKGITSAVTFDSDIREVFSLLPGISEEAMGKMKDQVLDLNNEFGAVSSDTIPALYDALSAGVPQGNVFEFLEVSQRLATAGATDVSTSVDGLTTVVNAFGLQADDAGKVADVLFSGVKAGKCVTGSTQVLLADGRRKRIDEMQDGGTVVAYDGRAWVASKAKWVDQGTKQTRILTTHLGRKIETTPEHPYLTITSHPDNPNPRPEWKRVDQIDPATDRVAVPTHLGFFGDTSVPEHIAGLLGLWIAEGSSDLSGGVRIASNAYGAQVASWAEQWHPEMTTVNVERRDVGSKSWRVSGPFSKWDPNPITSWLRGFGFEECTSATKHIPEECFSWDRQSMATLIHWLFNGDGWLSASDNPRRAGGRAFQLGFCSKSEQLVRDVNHMLLRFGIVGRIRYREKVDAWVWETSRHEEMKRFLQFIGIDRPAAQEVLDYQPARKGNKRRGEVVEFDRITSIEVGAEERVYDLCVPGLMNFVANDIVAHNTTIDELSASLFQVAPIASTLGVPIEDVTAGFATLTAQGVPTAQAATQMKAAMVALTKPTDAMQETFKKFTGQTAEDFLKSGGSMAEAFGVLNEATGGNVGQLTKMLGSVEAVQAVLGTSGGNADVMAANLEAMANSAGAVDTAFEVMDSGIGATWDKIRARATSGLIGLGEQFFPIIQKTLDTIIVHGPLVRAEVMRIGTQVWEAIQPILAVIVGFVRDVAVPAFLSFSAWMTETGLPAARAFALEVQQRMQPVIERIAAFVVGTLIPNFRALVEWIRDQGIPGFMAGVAALRDHLQPTFQAVAGFVQNGLMPAFRAIANFISTTVVPVAMRLFGVFINNILPTLANLASFLLVNVVPAFLAVATIITGKIIPLVLRLAGAVIPKLMTVFEVMATVATTAFNVVLAVARPVLDVITKVIDGIASIDLSNIPGAGLLGDIGGAIFGADGGVFTQATNAIIGEAGPEILLPLTRPKRMVEIMNAAGGPVLQALAEDGGSTQPRNRRDGSSGGDRTYNIYGVDANDVVVEIERNDRDLAGAGF